MRLLLRQRLPLRLLKVALTIVFILFCLQWLMPAIGLYLLKNWYSEQGEGYELSIHDWQFSPWRGELGLSGVTFTHAGETASFDELSLNIAMLALWQRSLVIENLSFNGLSLFVHQNEQDLELLGLSPQILLANSKDGSEPAEVDTTQDDEDPWGIEIQNIELNDHELSFQNLSLDVSASITKLQIKSVSESEGLTLDGEFRLKSLRVPQAEIQINAPITIKTKGVLTDLFNNPSWQGELSLANVKIHNPWLPDAGFKQLTLLGMTLSAEQQWAQTLMVDDLYIEKDLLALTQYSVSDIRFKKNVLTTGLHEWSGLTSTIRLNQEGKLEQLKVSASVDKQDTGKSNTLKIEDSKDTMPFKVMISEVRQKPEHNSLIRILNPHVTPKLNTDITVNQLVIKNINNQQQYMHLNLAAQAGEYSDVSLIADMTMDDQVNGELTLKIDQFDLIPLNGYVAKAIGYHVEQGQLNLDASINVKQGRLSGNSQLMVRNSYLVPENQATMDRISKQISMPIETALSLIKDDNNNMKMNIPIKGDIHAPDFGVDDLVSQLTRKALTAATLHYIQQAIFPYGLLVSVADYVGDELFSISLTPIVLTADDLDDDQKAYLIKVVSLMQEKESLQLRVCALVKRDDKQDDWHETALSKAKKIKRYLVDQDNTLSSRIVLCEPKLSDKSQVLMGF